MENGRFIIDTAALQRDTAALQKELRSIQGEVDGLFDSLAALNRMWSGPANEAMDIQVRNDCENMKDLCLLVGRLLESMKDAAGRYEKGEGEAEAAVAAIRS